MIASTDLSVYTEQEEKCQSQTDDLKDCLSFKRLFVCLRYYSLLNIQTKKEHANIFEHFIDTVYKMEHLLNDYHHIIKKHSNRLKRASNYLIEEKSFEACDDVKQCQYSSRHHKEDNNKELGALLSLYCSTLD